MFSNEKIYIHSWGFESNIGSDDQAFVAAYSAAKTGFSSCDGAAVAKVTLPGADEFAHCRKNDPTTALAVKVAQRAKDRMLPQDVAAQRRGVIFGSSRGAAQSLEKEFNRYLQHDDISANTSPETTLGRLSGAVAMALDAQGIACSVSAACTTGLQAVGIACALLHSRQLDLCFAGGSESCVTPFVLAMLKRMRIYTRSSDCSLPCKPFSSIPTGLALGEGAACLSLSRNADGAIASILGFAACNERSSASGISPNGFALQQAMSEACERAGVEKESIDILVAHGTGTPKGDRAELNAYLQFFKEAIPPIVCHKWLVGHTLGASGVLSLVFALFHLQHRIAAPLPYPNLLSSYFTVPQRWQRALVVGLGFSGNANAVIVQRED